MRQIQDQSINGINGIKKFITFFKYNKFIIILLFLQDKLIFIKLFKSKFKIVKKIN